MVGYQFFEKEGVANRKLSIEEQSEMRFVQVVTQMASDITGIRGVPTEPSKCPPMRTHDGRSTVRGNQREIAFRPPTQWSVLRCPLTVMNPPRPTAQFNAVNFGLGAVIAG